MTVRANQGRDPRAQQSTSQLAPFNRSRRQWIAASAATVAGSLVACGDDRSGGGMGACPEDDVPPATLPSFDEDRCLRQIEVPTIPEDSARFSEWNRALRARAAGRESAFVDLDAVDHNLGRVGQRLGSRFALRLVAKSLPSVRLLEYMMVTACTNRVMAFSEGMVRDLLYRFGSDVDILLGRPQTADAAERTFAALDSVASGGANPAETVRWLVDTEDRLVAYRDLAEARGVPIRVSVEIDVGLRRGGAIDNEALLSMLTILDRSSLLEFAGLMGYDGHVPFAPDGIDSETEFLDVQQRYADFVRAGRDAFPSLFEGEPVYNGGGTRTYHLYTDELDTPINEIAMGSGFVYPSNFSNIPDEELRAATFLASPVLKRIDPAEVPFVQGLLPTLAEDDPNLEVSFYLVAGGFPGVLDSPTGLVDNPLNPSPAGVNNLLSNQQQWLGARDLPLQIGDFVFYHPWEGDGIRWLSRLDVFRGGTLVDQWQTFQPGVDLA